MPSLAILRAATKVYNAIYATLLHKHSSGGAERWCEVYLETAIAIEVARILAVELQTLLVRNEHRYAGAVFACEEYLLGCVVRCVELNLRCVEEGSFTALELVVVDVARCGIVSHRVVCVVILASAVKTTDSTDCRQLYLADKVTLAVVLQHLVLRIDKVEGKEVLANCSYTLERMLCLWDKVATLSCVEVHSQQTIVWCIVVCKDKGSVLIAVENHIVVVKTLEECLETLLALALVEQLVAGSTCRACDEEPTTILALATVEVVERVARVGIDKRIVALRSAYAVVVDLLIGIQRRVDAILRCIVGTIVKSLVVGCPACA